MVLNKSKVKLKCFIINTIAKMEGVLMKKQLISLCEFKNMLRLDSKLCSLVVKVGCDFGDIINVNPIRSILLRKHL